MAKKSKKYVEALGKIDRNRLYDSKEALTLVSEIATAKFDETVEAHVKLGVDSRHADQQVRGAIVLPHGTGKTKKVLVFAKGEKAKEAEAAGADFVGAEDLVQKIQKENWFDFDVVVATPDMMGVVGRLGRVLGPKGLMPNPKSGTVTSGNIKSAIGLGLILNQGIGDTIRVSLTDNPVEEIASAKLILKTLGLRKGGISVVSCPTCGRTQIDLIGLAKQVEKMVSKYDLDIKVAVMGCVVNGPGEAREADLGIAGGKGEGLLIKKGEIVKRVPENELLNTLEEELKNWRN